MEGFEEWDGERVRRLRKALGLTQQELAEDLGTWVSVISRWERNHKRPRKVFRRQLEAMERRAGL